MRPQTVNLEAAGLLILQSDLSIPRAQQFAHLLSAAGDGVYASLVEARKIQDGPKEVVVFQLQTERPQFLVNDIRKHELLQAIFHADDSKPPEVYVLRADFPRCPHLAINAEEFPRQLCLYEQSWEDVRHSWTAARFLARVRYWLEKTATGRLHAADQPLEPLIVPSGSRLILPSDFDLAQSGGQQGLLSIYWLNRIGAQTTFVAYWRDNERPAKEKSVAAVFKSSPQRHGIIRRQPSNLSELDSLCRDAGLDLLKELAEKIQTWHRDKPAPQILASNLVLIILLPKTRHGEEVESMEVCAFVSSASVEEVGQALGVIQKHDGKAGYIIGGVTPDTNKLAGIGISILQVLKAMDATTAAWLNGHEPFTKKIVAIGAGALGSQIANNLLRSGFGRWTIADSDVLLPHNCARHCLGDWAVGFSKAEAMSAMINSILNGSEATKGIQADILKPGDSTDALAAALEQADLILDFSASIAVSRHLARLQYGGRQISAFMTPDGQSLVVAAEDAERKVRLDWLEMLHYRAVINDPRLLGSYLSNDGKIRYGNSCRDISMQLSQDDVAISAGLASKAIRHLEKGPEGGIKIYKGSAHGAVEVIEIPVSELFSVSLSSWTLRFDQGLLDKLWGFRAARLPNETGGILLGHFDTYHKVCSIVDVIPSPPDSKEWPISYIRGCEGLNAAVQEVSKKTLDQLGYVGEWHSHPDGCSTLPSSDDMKAYQWIMDHLSVDDLPAIMLIVGEGSTYQFVASGA